MRKQPLSITTKPEIKDPANRQVHFLTSISPETGRWYGQLETVGKYFSEFATYKYRIRVIVEWIKKLNSIGIVGGKGGISSQLKKKELALLDSIWSDFTIKDAETIWKNDLEMNHDTKASVKYVQAKLTGSSIEQTKQIADLGLTATDIDNLAFALSLKDFLDQA